MGEEGEREGEEPGVLDRWFDYCEQTSAHGLCHIRRGRPLLLNLSWGLCFLVASSAALVGIVQVLHLLLPSYPSI